MTPPKPEPNENDKHNDLPDDAHPPHPLLKLAPDPVLPPPFDPLWTLEAPSTKETTAASARFWWRRRRADMCAMLPGSIARRPGHRASNNARLRGKLGMI